MNDPETAQLRDLMARLSSRYSAIFGGVGYTVDVDAFAESIMADIRGAGSLGMPTAQRRACQQVVSHLIDDPSSRDFWGTPLGRTLFAAGAYPYAQLPPILAASVLGVTRQRVSQWGDRGGPLVRGSHGMVSRESVRELLIERLDKVVKAV